MPFPVKIFPSKLAASVPNNILRNPPLCWLASFWIVSQTLSDNKLESLRDLTISIMSFISSFDIISIVILLCEAEDEGRWPGPNIFLCIPASAVDAAAGNPKGIKTLLASCLITFLLVVILFLVMEQEVYQEILLIVSSEIFEFLIIWYHFICQQKLYEDLQLVY